MGRTQTKCSQVKADQADLPSRIAPKNSTPIGSFASAKWLTLILLGCVALGFYCCELNRQLYQHQNPFFDSVSYYEQLFRVMTISRQEGYSAAMDSACFSSTTVCLPFMIAAAVAPLAEPSRMVGVWIQVGYLFLFLSSLFFYLTRVQRLKPGSAAIGCFAFLTASCIFYENGGVSDFRMDLGLCLTFGVTAIWYLIAMAQPSKLKFALLGVAAAACCLSRATAPVYIIAALLPPVCWDLSVSSNRVAKLKGLGLTFAITSIGAGWFFVANYDYLHYYYAVWNTDANAKIPLAESLGHIKLTRRCIGEALILLLISWLVGLTLVTKKNGGGFFSGWHLLKSMWNESDFDWRILWIGVCPVLMMVSRQAGLNPFVCMPAIIGLILWSLIPILKRQEAFDSPKLARYFWICLVVCTMIRRGARWRRHMERDFNAMAAHQQILSEIVKDGKRQELSNVRFGVMHLSDLNTIGLYGALLFDRKDVKPELRFVEHAGMNLRREPIFDKPAVADWDKVPGETDEAKKSHLVKVANLRMDYLVVPDASSAEQLQANLAHNIINRHLVGLRAKVVNGQWEKIAGPIQSDDQEFVEIYRRIALPDRIAKITEVVFVFSGVVNGSSPSASRTKRSPKTLCTTSEGSQASLQDGCHHLIAQISHAGNAHSR